MTENISVPLRISGKKFPSGLITAEQLLYLVRSKLSDIKQPPGFLISVIFPLTLSFSYSFLSFNRQLLIKPEQHAVFVFFRCRDNEKIHVLLRNGDHKAAVFEISLSHGGPGSFFFGSFCGSRCGDRVLQSLIFYFFAGVLAFSSYHGFHGICSVGSGHSFRGLVLHSFRFCAVILCGSSCSCRRSLVTGGGLCCLWRRTTRSKGQRQRRCQ